MDDPGHAARLLERQQAKYYSHPQASQLHGVETVEPLNGPAPHMIHEPVPDEKTAVGNLPPPEEREKVSIPKPQAEGYEVPNYRPPVWVNPGEIPGATQVGGDAQTVVSHAGPDAAAVAAAEGVTYRPGVGERHHSIRDTMSPHLQFMAGPMLAYHTVADGVWHGAAMIVTSDAGSIYEPRPELTLFWDQGDSVDGLTSNMAGLSHNWDGEKPTKRVEGEVIYVYHGPQGTFTFTRFKIEVPLGSVTTKIRYRVNHGTELQFHIPGVGENLRWSAHSCNGFSGGVDMEQFYNKEKFENGYDPMWTDMLEKHAEKPFHCMVGGGDQIYCDSLTYEPELQEWINAGQKYTAAEKMAMPLTDEIQFAIDRYYFSHYCKIFRAGAFGLANATIPMVNMLDDHDLIDGFGSYPDDLQQSPIFSHIGSRGYFWFLLFQLFTVDAVDGTNYEKPHYMNSMIIGGEGPWIPFPNHSLLVYFGPEVAMVLLDCRAERKRDLVCSQTTYDRVWKAVAGLPRTVKHIVFQLGIPIAYPRMNFLEKALDSGFNPVFALNKVGIMPGFVNKFNKEAELLDDLNDHWCAGHHKKERNWLVEQTQRIAREQHVRISFLSGDVHCAAVAFFYSSPEGIRRKRLDKAHDPKYMLQIVTSAIVNTPPPPLVSSLVSKLGRKTHKTMHYCHTEEEMEPIFTHDTDGKELKDQSVLGRRNWTQVDFLPNGELQFDIRVEIKQGDGESKGYPISAPPPLWAD